jgi:hypothetical protein
VSGVGVIERQFTARAPADASGPRGGRSALTHRAWRTPFGFGLKLGAGGLAATSERVESGRRDSAHIFFDIFFRVIENDAITNSLMNNALDTLLAARSRAARPARARAILTFGDFLSESGFGKKVHNSLKNLDSRKNKVWIFLPFPLKAFPPSFENASWEFENASANTPNALRQ